MSEYVDAAQKMEVDKEIALADATARMRAQHERIGESFLRRTRAFGKVCGRLSSLFLVLHAFAFHVLLTTLTSH